VRSADLLRTLLKRLPCALLLALWFAGEAASALAGDSFEGGWSAYEQGDFAQAAALWRPLAEQGHANAQINLGVLYEHGYGVDQDLHSAAAWYRAAAAQGSAIGQYNLGLFLAEHGSSVPGEQDPLYWLGKAADQGFADAQFQVGLMYARGLGGEARSADAAGWLYQAGLAYLYDHDGAGVESAVAALQRVASGEPLARDLEARLASGSGPSAPAEASTAVARSATGTAWPIAAGYAVTNYHIVAGKQSLVLIDSRGAEIAARIAISDAGNDIALLAVDNPQRLPPALPVATAAARLGASVFTIGFPRVDVMGGHHAQAEPRHHQRCQRHVRRPGELPDLGAHPAGQQRRAAGQHARRSGGAGDLDAGPGGRRRWRSPAVRQHQLRAESGPGHRAAGRGTAAGAFDYRTGPRRQGTRGPGAENPGLGAEGESGISQGGDIPVPMEPGFSLISARS